MRVLRVLRARAVVDMHLAPEQWASLCTREYFIKLPALVLGAIAIADAYENRAELQLYYDERGATTRRVKGVKVAAVRPAGSIDL